MAAPIAPDISYLLESIQLSEFRRAKLRPPEHDADGVRAWLERIYTERMAFEGGGVVGHDAADQLARKYRSAYAAHPPATRYELIHYYMHLVVVAQSVIANIRVSRPNAVGLDAIVFGMIPATYPNAIILPLPGGMGTAVLFNFGTFSLAVGLARFLATYGDLTIWPTGEYSLDLHQLTLLKNMKAAPAEFDRLLGTLEAILFGSTETLDIEVQPPPLPKGRNYQSLLSGMIHFIVSHEIAHLLQRHDKPPRLLQKLKAWLLYGNAVGATTKMQEIEADTIGLYTSISAHDTLAREGKVTDVRRRGSSAILESYTGASLILGMFEGLETVAQLHTCSQEPVPLPSLTHPTIHERRESLRKQVAHSYPAMKQAVNNSTDAIDGAVALISSALLNRIALRGNTGRPLSPMWSRVLAEAGVPSELPATNRSSNVR